MKVIAKNRRARYDYDIERIFVAGLVLTGAETKSIRNGLVSLKGSFAYIKDSELWCFNIHISPYPHANLPASYEPTRPRKLLVNQRELDALHEARIAGRSIVPLTLLAGRFVKLEIGVGQGKKKFDKRQAIKKRDSERAIRTKNPFS